MSIATAHSAPDIMHYFKVNGCTLVDCSIQAEIAPALFNAPNYHQCSIFDLTPECSPIKISGNCRNLTISGQGTIEITEGITIDGMKVDNFRGTFVMGDHVRINNVSAQNACFLRFECGNDVTVSNADFQGAIFCHAEIGNMNCVNWDLRGAHLNPTFEGARFTGCLIDNATRLENACLNQCEVTNLMRVDEKGCKSYITNLSEINGLEPHPCGLTDAAKISMSFAGLSGGTSVECNSSPIGPNVCRPGPDGRNLG